MNKQTQTVTLKMNLKFIFGNVSMYKNKFRQGQKLVTSAIN